ncbi:MAG: ATP-binding cassette domain-containing protein, partial [Aeromicrobium sp.]
MSAEDLLCYFAELKGVSSKSERTKLLNEVLEITNLSDVRKKNVDGFSGGMKQRFGIAQLLLNNPKLIIVDEPTAGLDPAERNRFRGRQFLGSEPRAAWHSASRPQLQQGPGRVDSNSQRAGHVRRDCHRGQ